MVVFRGVAFIFSIGGYHFGYFRAYADASVTRFWVVRLIASRSQRVSLALRGYRGETEYFAIEEIVA